jgi:hypothetical protein
VLHLHHFSRDVVVSETFSELDPREGVAVLSWVGLPPIKSGASQLPCCVQNSLPVIALSDIQLALHRTKPVVCLEWISRMGERRRVTPQKVRTLVAGLLWWRRWRLSVDLLQSLNSVVQSSHHLHLELEELLQSQRWRHRHWLASTLVVLPRLARTGAGAPGVHHLFAAGMKFIRDRYCTIPEGKL